MKIGYARVSTREQNLELKGLFMRSEIAEFFN